MNNLLLQVTTLEMLEERAKMLCPRLGDSFTRTAKMTEILDGTNEISHRKKYSRLLNYFHDDTLDVASKALIKCATKKSNTINLSSLKLTRLPEVSGFVSELQSLTDINLSKNNLFGCEEMFTVSKI